MVEPLLDHPEIEKLFLHTIIYDKQREHTIQVNTDEVVCEFFKLTRACDAELHEVLIFDETKELLKRKLVNAQDPEQ